MFVSVDIVDKKRKRAGLVALPVYAQPNSNIACLLLVRRLCHSERRDVNCVAFQCALDAHKMAGVRGHLILRVKNINFFAIRIVQGELRASFLYALVRAFGKRRAASFGTFHAALIIADVTLPRSLVR